MKNNPVNMALVGALIAVAVLCVWFLLSYNMTFRELRQLQPRVMESQKDKMIIQSLAAELIEYSKTHPAIDPLLQSLNMKPGGSNAPAATTPKPAAR